MALLKPLSALASVLPSGLNDTLTPFVCPVNVFIFLPVETSHKRTVLSQLPLAIFVPSGLKDTLSTCHVCPVNIFIFSPVETSHK